jgi:hypothetical protein
MACLVCGSASLEPAPPAYGSADVAKILARRPAGALVMLPSLALAAFERLPRQGSARAGTMFFGGRKAGDGHVP